MSMANWAINRLQHALDVQGAPSGDLYIADTYNSRIKVIRAGDTATNTVYGLGGLGGYADGDTAVAEFDEPGGLSYANGALYVADTNNHVIRTIDLDAGLVDTLEFSNPEALVIDPEAVTILGGNTADSKVVQLDTQDVATGEGTISLSLSLPEDFKINPLINSKMNFVTNPEVVSVAGSVSILEKQVHIPVTFAAGEDEFNAELTLYYCRDGAEGLCYIETVIYLVPLVAADDHSLTEIALERTVVAPEV